MIKRIVKLTFQDDKINDFLEVFEASKSKIRNFNGCCHVELLQAQSPQNVFFTFSFWENEEALENYRQSELFRTTWSQTKKLFADKPSAWTVNLIDEG